MAISGGNKNDGFFEIEYRYDGIFLTIHPGVGAGRRVDISDVIERIELKKIADYNRDAVKLAVIKADRTPVKIAGAQEEAKINASVAVTISVDKLKAFITISPPFGGRMLNLKEIMDILAAHGVVYGVKKEELEQIAADPIYNEMICVAEGLSPIDGKDGSVDYKFNIDKKSKPTILDDGRVDFRELNNIESVIEGQVLCTLIAPQHGVTGKTVLGNDIKAINGKAPILPKGTNVKVGEDGISLVSCIDGKVEYAGDKINVYSNYEVPADVDNSTGNIYFVGNVVVKGNVLSGFVIEAGGSVEVWGVVEGAAISAQGDIILRRGMQGLGKGSLISGRDIIARYIEHSNGEAKNDIKSEAVMHSNVKCGGKLELSGGKGLLVGGSCRVGKEIIAKVIGSRMATVTEIEVGVNPSLRERYKAIKDEIAESEAAIKKAEQAIEILKKLEASGAMTPEKRDFMAKSVRTKLTISASINSLRNEFVQIETAMQQEINGKIKASGFIYPGTRISIGTCKMFVKDPLQYCTVYRDGADLRVGSMEK